MRECGMLLPVSSLPSRYGIGAFSGEAYDFIDTLQRAGQKYWQILPLGPTGYGDSPYQSFSAFAGNPYFIDLEAFIEEELLTKEECDRADFGDNRRYISYDKLYQNRFPLLKLAFERWMEKNGKNKAKKYFAKSLTAETREYCLYMAIKNDYDGEPWINWDKPIRLHQPDAVKSFAQKLENEIMFYQFQQLKFQEQWKRLKAYANAHEIKIIGDIPIYVAFDSADAWAHPELFQFDEENLPVAVAGCPPDAFSETGQLWGNPLYCWEYHKKTDFAWWMKRMEYSFRLYDVVRVDHFRGFDEYYSIPYGNKDATEGTWEKGPGISIFRTMKKYFATENLPIIAEDLGFLTPSVLKLVEETGFPGMKVLEFAFDCKEESAYLPHNYTKNCVVYTGTHDNDTLRGWFEKMPEQDRFMALEYINGRNGDGPWVNWDFIRLALASVANLAIIPVQDYLGLGTDARINEPSTLGKNWKWRMKEGELTNEICQRARRMARLYARY
ncbi:MAG: 4-alpha-glucanotransferase [Lachnospiraceae bacterium]|nr:4-alpha-glucanotransferase [Lachnospiraceae bacterium]